MFGIFIIPSPQAVQSTSIFMALLDVLPQKRDPMEYFTYWLLLSSHSAFSSIKDYSFLFDFGMRQHIYAYESRGDFTLEEYGK